MRRARDPPQSEKDAEYQAHARLYICLLYTSYDCEHVLATLLSDVLFQYHQCGGSGVKTADVLNYILARQTRQNWKLGACDFKRYFEYNWENSTLLAALFAVPECFDSEYLWSWDTTVYPLSLIHISIFSSW